MIRLSLEIHKVFAYRLNTSNIIFAHVISLRIATKYLSLLQSIQSVVSEIEITFYCKHIGKIVRVFNVTMINRMGDKYLITINAARIVWKHVNVIKRRWITLVFCGIYLHTFFEIHEWMALEDDLLLGNTYRMLNKCKY